MIACRATLVVLALAAGATTAAAQPLPGTQPLDWDGDLAAKMVAGIDKYLMRELEATTKNPRASWKPDISSPEAYTKWATPRRDRLKKILGVVDQPRTGRTPLCQHLRQPSFVAETNNFQVHTVRWTVLPGVDVEGLLLEPQGQARASVVAIPDADWTPDMLAGLAKGVPAKSQFARLLADNGCRVLIPTLIDRQDTWSGSPAIGRMTNQPHREFIYRMAYEMGRHIIGYEIQKVLAAVDWFAKQDERLPIGVFGYGEGGLLAFYSAAIDERIQSTVVSSYVGNRENIWQQPIYRNVWGLLPDYVDAEITSLMGKVSTVDGKSRFGMQPSCGFQQTGADGGRAAGAIERPIGRCTRRTECHEPTGLQRNEQGPGFLAHGRVSRRQAAMAYLQ